MEKETSFSIITMVLAYQAQGPATTANVTQNFILADGILAYRDIYSKVFINFAASQVLMNGFSRDLERLSREDVVQTNLIYHSEREDYYQNATVQSMTYVSGKQFRINYATASVDVVDGVFMSPGREQDIILAADGVTRARIDQKVAPTGSSSGHYIIVSADTVTDVSSGPLQSAFMAKFTGGSAQIAFIGQAGSELGAFPDGTYQNFNIYGVEFQKLRDATSTWSMESSGQQLYVSVAGAPGNGSMPFSQALGIMLERFEVNRSIALLTGTGRSYTDQVTGKLATECMGLTTSTLTFGGSTTITNATAYTEETLQDVIRYVDSQGMGTVIYAQCGREAYFKLQDLMGAISNAQAVRYQYNGKEAADFEFFTWQWGGKTWHIKLAPEFQAERLLNAGNAQANYWPNSIVFYQMGAEMSSKLGNSGSQQTKPFFSTKIYGQMQSGTAPGTFVKTQMVYRDAAILGTEASKVICSQRFGLQIQGVQKFYMIEGA